MIHHSDACADVWGFARLLDSKSWISLLLALLLTTVFSSDSLSAFQQVGAKADEEPVQKKPLDKVNLVQLLMSEGLNYVF